MITQSLVKYFFNGYITYPIIYSLCLLHQLLLEVNKSWCTATHTQWWYFLYHTLYMLSHMQPKKPFELFFIIRAPMNNWLDMYVIVARMVSSTKRAPPISPSTPSSGYSSDYLYTSPHFLSPRTLFIWSSLFNVAWYMSEVQ